MEDIDEDGSGQLEFQEFVMLSARFLSSNLPEPIFFLATRPGFGHC